MTTDSTNVPPEISTGESSENLEDIVLEDIAERIDRIRRDNNRRDLSYVSVSNGTHVINNYDAEYDTYYSGTASSYSLFNPWRKDSLDELRLPDYTTKLIRAVDFYNDHAAFLCNADYGVAVRWKEGFIEHVFNMITAVNNNKDVESSLEEDVHIISYDPGMIMVCDFRDLLILNPGFMKIAMLFNCDQKLDIAIKYVSVQYLLYVFGMLPFSSSYEEFMDSVPKQVLSEIINVIEGDEYLSLGLLRFQTILMGPEVKFNVRKRFCNFGGKMIDAESSYVDSLYRRKKYSASTWFSTDHNIGFT